MAGIVNRRVLMPTSGMDYEEAPALTTQGSLLLMYVQNSLFRLLSGRARKIEKKILEPVVLDDAANAFAAFGTFSRCTGKRKQAHVLQVTDVARLFRCLAFEVREKPHFAWIPLDSFGTFLSYGQLRRVT